MRDGGIDMGVKDKRKNILEIVTELIYVQSPKRKRKKNQSGKLPQTDRCDQIIFH